MGASRETTLEDHGNRSRTAIRLTSWPSSTTWHVIILSRESGEVEVFTDPTGRGARPQYRDQVKAFVVVVQLWVSRVEQPVEYGRLAGAGALSGSPSRPSSAPATTRYIVTVKR